MGLVWNDSLKTGVTWQDDQHKELFDKINVLFDAMKRCEGKQEIIEMVGFLDGYVVKHFGYEEAAMKRTRYPDSAPHLEAHTAFKKMISSLRSGIDGGASTRHLVKAQSFLFEWFYNHVGKTDKALGEFLMKTDHAG